MDFDPAVGHFSFNRCGERSGRQRSRMSKNWQKIVQNPRSSGEITP